LPHFAANPTHGYFIYDKSGEIIGTNPQPPSIHHIFGTDAKGRDLFYRVIEGAKFTFFMALLIGCIRVAASLIIGTLLSTIFAPIKKWLFPIADAFHYAPAALIIYAVVAPFVVVYGWAFDSQTKFLFILFGLTFVAIPSLSLFISSEIDFLKKEEFIHCARLLGGRSLHQLRTHYWPHLRPKLMILFTQHFIQIMLLFAHLGLLGLFLGGTHVEVTSAEVTIGNGAPAAHAENESVLLGNDWGGLIAESKEDFGIYPWLILAPVTAFTITILAVTGILTSVKNPFHFRRRLRIKRNETTPEVQVTLDDFEMNVKESTPM
jgi:peptide/nickel transport system permease protein